MTTSTPERSPWQTSTRVAWWLLIVGNAFYAWAWAQLSLLLHDLDRVLSGSESQAPGRDDHLYAAVTYGGGVLLMALALVGLFAFKGPKAARYIAGLLAVVLAIFATRAVLTAVNLPAEVDLRGPWYGLLDLVVVPWTWPLILLGIAGLYRMAFPRRTPDQSTAPEGLLGAA